MMGVTSRHFAWRDVIARISREARSFGLTGFAGGLLTRKDASMELAIVLCATGGMPDQGPRTRIPFFLEGFAKGVR